MLQEQEKEPTVGEMTQSELLTLLTEVIDTRLREIGDQPYLQAEPTPENFAKIMQHPIDWSLARLPH